MTAQESTRRSALGAARAQRIGALILFALATACSASRVKVTEGEDAGPTVSAPCGLTGEACCAAESCHAGLVCLADVCQAPPADVGKICTTGTDCVSGTCFPVGGGKSVCTSPCADDADCAPGWTCDPLQGQPRNLCGCTASAEVCDGKDNDCNGQVDDTEAPIKQCTAMGTGYSCSHGACTCALMCGGTCVDPLSDPLNCGVCGRLCGDEGICVAGQCTCPQGDMLCAAGCVPENAANCGRCGTGCATGASCVGHHCACPAGGSVCSGTCVDLQNDGTNCGTCGNTCPSNLICSGGRCLACTAAQACNGTCIDTRADVNNCGACGVVCAAAAPSTAACIGGSCRVVISSGAQRPTAVAVDQTRVYWTDGLGTVQSAPKAGGPALILASGQSTPYAIAVDGSAVYWANRTIDGTIAKVPLAGGGVVTLAAGQNKPSSISVDSTRVFWGNNGNGTLLSTSLSGGPPTVHWTASGNVNGIGLDASHIYWAAQGSPGNVGRVSISGGFGPVLASDLPGPIALAVDAGRLYWADFTQGTIQSLALTGSGVTTIASGQGKPVAIAIDARNIYWANVADGTIVKAPLGGGIVTVLATGAANPYGIAIDSTSVYWVNHDDGTVNRITPK